MQVTENILISVRFVETKNVLTDVSSKFSVSTNLTKIKNMYVHSSDEYSKYLKHS